jgi:acid stress chaperone HdeB
MTRAAIAIVVLVLTLMSSSGLRAQVALDVTKISCQQFVTYKITNPQFIAIWVSGYYHGTLGKMVVDTQELVANAKKLENYCLKNPEILLMQAVETVTGKSTD